MIVVYRKISGAETEVNRISNRDAVFVEEVMGANEIGVTVTVDAVLDITEGDYIKHDGIIYALNRDAQYTINADVRYSYELIFEHPEYTLINKLLENKITGYTAFTLTGKLSDFASLVVWCMNQIDSGWTIGSIIDTNFKTITIADINCREALKLFAKEFDAEYYFNGTGKSINFAEQVERTTNHVFEQGRDLGLYSISQQNVDKEDTVTRVLVRGGNQNVPIANADEEGYLKLPENYLENFSDHSKIVERKVKFEEEFPHFVGSASSVSGENNRVITCPDIDFNISDIAVGDTARINFLTGDLMGNSFEFAWNNANKQITLIYKEDEVALPDQDGVKPNIPSASKKAKVGDTFNFTGVIMPASYVNASITRLRSKGQKWLDFHSKKRVKFNIDIDHRWMRGKNDLRAGDVVVISIPQKDYSQVIRVTKIEKQLRSNAISATVSNYLEETWEKYYKDRIEDVKNTILAQQANTKRTLETIFKDGIVTESELKVIESVLDRLYMERGQMNAQYLVVQGNPDLVNKVPLTNAWSSYQAAYINVRDSIENAISDGKITEGEKDGVNSKLSLYATQLNSLVSALETARGDIEDHKNQSILDITQFNLDQLQNQVDGQVNNWFYPYVPSLANYPASEWTTNEIRDRHIGDTFTNTQAFVDNATTPNAGKSWRYVKNESTYSWTLIADSDAVKALLQASQAQATADGKSTTFLVQPSNYHLGDTWVLNSDRTVNGTAYKQGEILTATQDSVTFNEAHWMKRVRYAGQAEINEAVVKATYWSIKANTPVIYKDAINASTSGTHTPVTISGELRSGTTTTSGGFITVTPNGGTEAGTASASPVTIAPANGDGKTSYTVRLYDAAAKTTLLDTMTIPVVFKGASGVNAISAVLSNEADVLPASPEGVVSDYTGSGTIIRVFEGATELTYGTGNGQYQVSASGSGITVGTPSTSGNRRVYGVASNMISDNATITFTITGKTASGASFSLTKVQAFAKSRTGQKGDKGDKGVSISLVDVEFAKNTTPATAPTTGWSTTAPSLSGNEQLWTRTKTAYSSGNPTYSTPANITPKKGDTGAVGQGVESVTEEFAISTSKTTQPTTGWSTTQPTWIQGRYIWSRVKVVYKNPTDTVYTGYAVSSEWEAVNELEHSLRNLLDRTGEQKDRMIGPDGAFVAYIGSTLSAVPISVTPGERLIFTKTNSTLADNAWRYAFYDSNGVFIQRFSPGNEIHTRVVPAQAGTLRASYPDDSVLKIERDVDHNAISAKQEAEQAQLAADGYMRARYIRDYLNFNSGASSCEWVEIKAIRKGGTNIAQGKPVSGNGQYLTNIGRVVDGNIDSSAFYWAGSGSNIYVEIDLGSVYYDIDYIQIWHYYANGRTFLGTKTEISEDGVNWTTIFDSATEGTYAETAAGKVHTRRYEKVMAELNQSLAITDKFRTTINGGLINTVMMLLRELNSIQETAGISGIQGANKDNPAFWAGGTYEKALALIQFLSKMSAGTTPSTGEYEGLAKITMLHNGAAKVGDFIIEESGRIVMIDPATGKPRLMFTVYNLPLIADLMSGAVFSGSTNIGSGSTSTSQVLTGSTNVTKSGATATFGGTTISISGWGSLAQQGMSSSARANLYAYRGGVRALTLASVMIMFSAPFGQEEYQTESKMVNPLTTMLANSGTYTFRLEVESSGNVQSVNATSSGSSFSWQFTEQDVRYQQYGLDGMMFFYSNHHFHFTEGGGLDSRTLPDKWNAPGVLAAGSASSGGHANKWGAKAGNSSVISGGYRITLVDMTHNNYVVQVTPHTGTSSFRVGTKTSTYFEIFGTGGCDYVVIGNNY